MNIGANSSIKVESGPKYISDRRESHKDGIGIKKYKAKIVNRDLDLDIGPSPDFQELERMNSRYNVILSAAPFMGIMDRNLLGIIG